MTHSMGENMTQSSGIKDAVDSPIQPAGLTTEAARRQLAAVGRNSLPEKKPPGTLKQLARQFANPLIYILLFALAVDLLSWWHEGSHRWPAESIAIASILILNAVLGLWQERKAGVAIARLRLLAAPRAWVRRDQEWQHVDAADLVPGDVVRVEAGDRVPADGMMLAGTGVAVDESILTGESLAVEKSHGDELLSGSLVTRGRSFIEVTRTGLRSTLGKIAGMLDQVDEEPPPLERRLKQFGIRVARGVIVFCAVMTILGVLTQGTERWPEIFLFSVALAVAAVPEGLPAVMTLTLALGVERMAGRKAVVRRLAAVESLGSVTVILTDKTGTLTENRMTVLSIETDHEPEFLRAVTLANDADGQAGDPIDLALARYAETRGVDVPEARRSSPRLSSQPFDSQLRFQRVTVNAGGQPVSYLKGAPETLLERSVLDEAARRRWLARAAVGAGQGHRVLAAAKGMGEADTELEFLGLVHLWDPVRPEAADALRSAGRAGIRVAMVTGDHPVTAAAIGKQVGLDPSHVVTGEDLDKEAGDLPVTEIYARVRPEHKLRLVEALLRRGEVVAMTGDGVNDAPALKRADVGVAMGQRGSDVAREVADIVLLDDNFATIVAAIEEGRCIYRNTEKFIRFLLATNLAEVIVVLTGLAFTAVSGYRDAPAGLLLPLTAVQVLWMNLVTDGLPALALAMEPPGSDTMNSPPRKSSAGLLEGSGRWVLLVGILLACVSLVAGYGLGTRQSSQTMLFTTLTVSQILVALAVGTLKSKVLVGSCVVTLLLQMAAVYTPVGQAMLKTRPLTARELILCLALSTIGLAVIEVQKWWVSKRPR
jgi:Ca2+-transporting ATPase